MRPLRRLAPALAALFAAFAYGVFLAAAACFVAFLGGLPGWRTIDGGPIGDARLALLADLALLALFGAQHSVMARAGFKRRWTRIVPPVIERAAYVLVSSLLLLLLVLAWRAVPAVLWSAPTHGVAVAMQGLFWAGAALVVLATFAIDHLELFGLDRARAALRGDADGTADGARGPVFRMPLLYRIVRHPMQLGFVVTFWATPVLTVGRVLLASVFTAYVLVGTWLEERDLLRTFAPEYTRYRHHVPRLVPRLRLLLPVVLVLVVTAVASPERGAGALASRTLRVGDVTRGYRVRLPHTRRGGTRVIVALHGASGDGLLMRALAGNALERWADARGAVVVYPQGVGRTWNDCRRGIDYPAHRAGADDVAFVRALLDTLAREHGTDTAAHVVGFSNGAHLALRLALEAPERVAAAALFGAAVPADSSWRCRLASAPMPPMPPILLVNGTDDAVSPFTGGAVRLPTGRAGGAVRSHRESVEWLAERAGHDVDRARRWERDVAFRLSFGTPGRAPVVGIAHRGAGHALPRRLLPLSLARERDRFDGVREALAFFDAVADRVADRGAARDRSEPSGIP
jgi:poly(3-hydroxybutyrate) depolymerase/protein-S-isoprenylcysteine O-methyltransferase Ste14